jgi:cation transport ATPase
MKYLLIILTVKSLKIVVEVIRISNNIFEDIRRTVGMASIAIITVILIPMGFLHLLVPASFLLQFRKYSRYNRLDF